MLDLLIRRRQAPAGLVGGVGGTGFLRRHPTVGQAIAAKVRAPPITVQDLRLTLTVVPINRVRIVPCYQAAVQGSSGCS